MLRVIVRPIIRMKTHLLILALLFASLCAADPEVARAQAPATGNAYQQFINQMVAPENLADCISRMDRLIDEAELQASSSLGVSTDTKVGLHLAFSIMANDQAILYYLVVSRNGQDLSYSDATRIAALFGDRAGLPHPVIITEGEKPVFYAQWFIKHSDWKAMHKMMLKVREVNRAEKDPQKAFVAAVIREVNARNAAQHDSEVLP